MIHRVDRPIYATGLACANFHIGLILDYIADEAGHHLDEAAFIDSLPEIGLLWSSFPKFREALIMLVESLGTDERAELREAFWNDISFADHSRENGYELRFGVLTQKIQDAARPFLESLYDNVLTSTTGYTRLPWQPDAVLNRTTLEDSYRSTNAARAKVCPVCLVPLPPPVRDTTQIDCDHFLPKSRYPALAIHPNNLIFTCMPCNERQKLAHDPLDRPGAGALQNTYIPYTHPAIDEIEPAYLENDGLPVVFKPIDDGRVDVISRLGNLERIYKVSEVYSGNLHNRTFPFIIKYVCARADDGMDKKQVEGRLNELLNFRDLEDYLTSSFAEWVIRNSVELFIDACHHYLSTGDYAEPAYLKRCEGH